ncbi:MAG: YtxH domain-containing protein [Dehalococcoidaceae bacterium]|nr:YtxH domain-containing protein [Dehalococcoidaceae bacterium]
MSETEKGAAFAMGILAGTAIGLAVGLLYAPRPGTETREMLKEKTDDARHKAADIVQEARERAKKIVEDARGKAAEINQQ